MGDVRLALRDALDAPAASALAATVAPRTRLWAAITATAVVMAIGAVSWAVSQRRPIANNGSPMMFSFPFSEPPTAGPIGSRNIAISEDGLTIAYASRSTLWIRRFDQSFPVGLVTPVSASNPFFSPDGAWVGYSGSNGLMRVRASGGTPELIAATASRQTGAVWGPDGTIVFGTTEGLYRVSASGGEATLIAKPDLEKKERLYGWPAILPGGRLLYAIVPLGEGRPRIAFLNTDSPESRVIVDEGTSPAVWGGQLLYSTGALLKRVTLDPVSGQVSGEAVTVPDIDIHSGGDGGAADFAISKNGTLVHLRSDAVPVGVRAFSWFDREGREEPVPIPPERSLPWISPDGSHVVLDRLSQRGRDLWMLNLERLSVTQLTDGPTEDLLPVWSPDGRRVFFASDRSGQFDIYSQSADGAGEPRLEYAAPGTQFPVAITPDGATLVVFENRKELVLVPLADPGRRRPLFPGDVIRRLPTLSPDGRWIAYGSEESGGQNEIFVRPFPDANSGRQQVSINGGRFARWRRTPDSTLEIVYLSLDGAMMAVPVTLGPRLSLGRPAKLFQWVRQASGSQPYDVSPVDGRFFMATPVDTSQTITHVSVVLNALSR